MADGYTTPKSKRFQDLTGRKFGRFTVIECLGRKNKTTFWLCRCDCGNERSIRAGNLAQGLSKSCGCLRAETTSEIMTTHGCSGRDEDVYWIWVGIKQRCRNERCRAYRWYGAVGVKLCDRWTDGEDGKSGYECFFEDIGPRPSKEHSVDRWPKENGNLNYEPGNVRWATDVEQARNTKSNRIVTYAGREMVLAAAIELSGLPNQVVRDRLHAGWAAEEALTVPKMEKGQRRG